MKKAFPMHDILTMRTGIVHKDFKTAHELMEWIVGHPIWTHEMPSHSELVESEMERQFHFLLDNSITVSVLNLNLATFGHSS